MLFGLFGKKTDYKALVKGGAVIVDVRTVGEFSSGHIKGSKNIPLDRIQQKSADLKKLNKTIIVCCKSGMRSGMAAGVLKRNGVEVYNGGAWTSLSQKI